MEPANPYLPSVHPPQVDLTNWRVWSSMALAAVSLLLVCLTLGTVFLFFWALFQYPVMGQLVDAPSPKVLELLMGFSCALGLVATVAAGVAAFAAVVLWKGRQGC